VKTLRRDLLVVLVHGLLAVGLIWPGVRSPTEAVPGGLRTDLWNTLWSLDFGREAILGGHAPWTIDVLAYPQGGVIPPADPLGMLFFVLFGGLGTALAYNLLVVVRLALCGFLAHRFAAELAQTHGASPEAARAGAWVAGVTMTGAPVLLAGVHNGTSEAFSGAGLTCAVWMCWRAAEGRGGLLPAALALLWAGLASWYSAVAAFVFAGLIAVLSGRGRPWLKRFGPLVLGLVLVLPWLLLVIDLLQPGGSRPLSAVDPATLATTRDTVGAAKLGSWFSWQAARDLGIRAPMEAGQGYLHTTFVPWALWVGAVAGLRGIWARERALLVGGAACFLLSLGSFLTVGEAELPMPFALLDELPGFATLALNWRFGTGTLLVLALIAARAAAGWRPRSRWALILAVALQTRFLSPVAGGVPAMDIRPEPVLLALADAPEGAVVHLPMKGQQATLYAQRIHRKPITAELNSGGERGLAFWDVARDHLLRNDEAGFLEAVEGLGVRYLVVHVDPALRADPNWTLYRRIATDFPSLEPDSWSGDLEVYALW